MRAIRILYGMLAHEANTFSTEEGSFERFTRGCWFTDDEIEEIYESSGDYISGMLQAAKEYGVELVPTIATQNAAPLLTRECIDTLMDELIGRIQKNVESIDGICLALHGAGAAEGIPDLEEYILSEVRKIVGMEMPITVCADLHGNISQQDIALCNGWFGIKEYPHVDAKQAGYLAMKSLILILEDKLHITTVVQPIRMLVPCAVGTTTQSPMKDLMEIVSKKKEELKLYDATFFHGFPYADVPCSSASVVVVTGESSTLTAEAGAREIADEIWKRREMLDIIYPQPEEAIATAKKLSLAGGPVIINESSDNAGAGCPGDGTYLLDALLRANIEGSIFGYIFDEEIAITAHQVGVGGKVSGWLGGKTDSFHGKPVRIEDATVCFLSDGNTKYKTPILYQLPVSYGKTARLRIGNVEIVVTEKMPEQTFDECPFEVGGVDYRQYRIVCLKSAIHFRAYFEKDAKAIVTTDPPGIQTGNLKQLSFKNVARPIWPIDEVID